MKRARWLTGAAGAAAGLAAAGRAGAAERSGAALTEDWSSFAVGPWRERSANGAWYLTYAGFGSVGIVHEDAAALELHPSPAAKGETHAALVTSAASFGDLELSATVTTVAQLRSDAPNPWEVGWLIWHYRDDDHFYYLCAKPNGWELGKRTPEDPGHQRFLLAAPAPAFPLGPHRLHVLHVGATIEVACDGLLLGTYVDRHDPYRSGKIGLYTEDAQVRFGPLSAVAIP